MFFLPNFNIFGIILSKMKELKKEEYKLIPNKTKRNRSLDNTMKNLSTIQLPKPVLKRGRSLPEALKHRRTIREIGEKKIPLQIISNLLWAAYGINRKKGPFGIPGRTAASASNSQEIDLYVALEKGVYIYEVQKHSLIPVVEGDFRLLAIGPRQKNIIVKAPVQLIYVADVNRLYNTSGYQEPGLQNPEIQKSYYFVDTGLIAGNVYLFAASYGLAAWFHNCNKAKLKTILKLHKGQRVLFGQTVGYPANH